MIQLAWKARIEAHPQYKDLCLIRLAALQAAEDHWRVSWINNLSPLVGCCGRVSRVVVAVCGGVIVTGPTQGTRHFWNRLPDGTCVDLTSCQFGGDGFTPLRRGRLVRLPPGSLAPIDSLAFTRHMIDALADMPIGAKP